jgi:general secretion pathway protein L
MECRVLFHDNTFQAFDWSKLDESTGRIMSSGSASIADIKQICQQDCNRLLVFISQQDVSMLVPELPARAGKQQLAAIAYSIEDQLAEDIELCFVANMPQQVDNTVPVAVIRREIMEDCMQALAQQQLQVRYVLPQNYLCPWAEDDSVLASLCPVRDGFLIRYGKHQGMFCREEILAQVLALLAKSSGEGVKVLCYSSGGMPDLKLEGISVEPIEAFHPLGQPLDEQDCINLKQKEYQSSQFVWGIVKMWKWPAVAIVILALTSVISQIVGYQSHLSNYRQLVGEQQQLLQSQLHMTLSDDPPKKQLIAYLSRAGVSQGQGGFLDLLHEYTRLKSDFADIKNDRIQFQNDQLVVNLVSKDLKSLESLRSRLGNSRYVSKVENVNISPEETTARLIMAIQ